MKTNIRRIYLYLLVLSLSILATSFVLQFRFHLQPCSLCIIDRALVIGITILLALAFIQNPQRRGQQVYGGLIVILTVLGIVVTTRHLWLIHLPPQQVPACSPGFNYLLGMLPLKDVLLIILKSSGECAQNNSAFLGLSLPGWTLLAFVMLLVGNLLPFWLQSQQKK